jgi:hypothetical protein
MHGKAWAIKWWQNHTLPSHKKLEMKNKFTDYLVQNGWRETSPMTYRKTESNYEIFFDNSNAVEIYIEGNRIKDAHLSELGDLINLLNTLS